MKTTAAIHQLPWFRQPWPWFLIALPATAIVGCVVTLVLAVRSADGVVADDYYRRGLEINQELARNQGKATKAGEGARNPATTISVRN